MSPLADDGHRVSLRRVAAATVIAFVFAGARRAGGEDAAPTAPAGSPVAPSGRCVVEGVVLRDGKPVAAAIDVHWAPTWSTLDRAAQLGLSMLEDLLRDAPPAKAIA